jgi:drug/metabolite transporter (DMT)-like permease
MLLSLVLSMPFMLVEGPIMPTLYELLGLAVLGLTISMGQIALSFAYKFEEASKISIYSYFQIILSLAFGFLLFSEIPTWTTILGGVIIFVSGYINYRVNLNRQIVNTAVGPA